MRKAFYIFISVLVFNPFHSQILVIAHRGASAISPENTLLAFEEAIKAGADYIETDVHQTSDGKVVIMHDLSVNRTCELPNKINKNKNKKVLIKELKLSEFLELKIKGQTFSPPTLDSAIKLINGRCKLLIELKKGNAYYPGIEKNILEIIQQNKAESWVDVIHSFDKKSLLQLQEQKTGAKLQKLIVFRLPLGSFTFSGRWDKDNFKNWQGVNSYYRFTSKRLIRKLHKEGKTVYAWTVNNAKWARKLKKRKIDGIITNNPAMVKEILAIN